MHWALLSADGLAQLGPRRTSGHPLDCGSARADQLELAAAEGCVLGWPSRHGGRSPCRPSTTPHGRTPSLLRTSGATQDEPATLPVPARSPPGTSAPTPWSRHAININDRAQLPAGADAVVPVEWTDGGFAQGQVFQPPRLATRSPPPPPRGARTRRMSYAASPLAPVCADADCRGASAGRKHGQKPSPLAPVVVLSHRRLADRAGHPLVPGLIWDSNSYISRRRPAGGRRSPTGTRRALRPGRVLPASWKSRHPPTC